MRMIRYFFALLVLVGCTNQSVSQIEKKLNGKYCSNTNEENPLVLFSDNTYSLGYVEKGRWEVNDYGDFRILTPIIKTKERKELYFLKKTISSNLVNLLFHLQAKAYSRFVINAFSNSKFTSWRR